MDFTNYLIIKSAIFVLSVVGFWVANRVYVHKKAQKPLVCPIQFDCTTVINSDYSKIFGIPVEVLGMAYYGFISLAYLSFFWFPQFWSYTLVVGLTAISLGAFIFSLYLIWGSDFRFTQRLFLVHILGNNFHYYILFGTSGAWFLGLV